MTPDPAEQTARQRRAAAILAGLLERAARENLPVLSWTISPAGAALTGRAVSYPASGRREHLTTWAQALGIELQERTSGGTTSVRGTGEADGRAGYGTCTVVLLADVYDEDDGAGPA